MDERSFPSITQQQFLKFKKEPLWLLEDAAHYVVGRKRLNYETYARFKGEQNAVSRLLGYASDAHQSGALRLIDAGPDNILHARVVPAEFIAWANNLPIDLPFLAPVPRKLSKNMSPEFKLMQDAYTKFWSEYDFANPQSKLAPPKKSVLKWMMEEATTRGIENFKEGMASKMDTILRCPVSRKGGTRNYITK